MGSANPLDISGGTHVGRVRRNNEDSFVIDQGLGLMAVADGMGGHNSGEVASRLATDGIMELAHRNPVVSQPAESGGPRLSSRGTRLRSLVVAANARVHEMGQASLKNRGMGTTLVAVWADSRSMTVAHVGDSRAYLHHAGNLIRLTEDHSVAGEQLRKGLISLQDAENSPFANILTRSLGSKAGIEVDVSEYALSPGDLILLASDGLTKMVSDDEVAQVIREDDAPNVLVDRLIRMALAAGGKDNVTVIAVRVRGQAP